MKVLEAIKRGSTSFNICIPPITIICVFNFISAVCMLTIIGSTPTPDKIAAATGPLAILFFLMMLAWIFISGGLFSSIMSVLKTGDLKMSEFIGNGAKYFLRLLGLNIAGGLISTVVWIVGAFLTGIFIALGGGNNIFFNIIGGIIILLTFICAMIVAMPLLISQYLSVINDAGIRDSLGKSIALMKKYFWKTVGFFLVLAVCIFSVSFLVNTIATVLGNAIKGMGAAVVSIVLTSIVNGVIGIFSTVSIMTYVLGIIQDEAQPAVTATTAE